ncbi:NADH-quinone oxidoreductase subunit NuoI [Campylobacter sp. faydin G-140]|uniref:NADH-quinone oxidoreductase subunit NuoI n=1 Tax=Campylobacter anatolicus TaxID=2829105 RepID=UPI001B997F10|nr:NADH-quinone oxidoreductase subunit NuoI [Campylobacter anatolicus]MBR8465461.1 NADH-quinone oxidoreductase subunit NuoI [Campylobacter anatolicus]
MDKRYILLDTRPLNITKIDKFRRFISRSFKAELFVGLLVVLKQMLFAPSHTLKYPMQKMQLSSRYRGVHTLMRFIESESERCIGCGLCEKICVSNCISMQTSLGVDGRKVVNEYSINLGRCVYCGFCADVCPELAITHGKDYEFASEQRAHFGMKSDFLTSNESLKMQREFDGFGSLPQNADEMVQKTPNAHINLNTDDTKEQSDV